MIRAQCASFVFCVCEGWGARVMALSANTNITVCALVLKLRTLMKRAEKTLRAFRVVCATMR